MREREQGGANCYSAFVLVVALVLSIAYFWIIRAFTKS